jgi:transposase
MFSYVGLEERVPQDHPLRAIRKRVDRALERISPQLGRIYARRMGRPSIAPEKLLRALLLQVLYTIRSERQLMEQLDYNLLYRWFVGLAMDERVWDPTVFTKNRERMVGGEIAEAFFGAVLAKAAAEGLLSPEHFSVDGTLIEAWASHKSFQPKRKRSEPGDDDPGNPTVDFRGERRRNDSHAAGARCGPAHGPEREQPSQRDRPPHDPPPWLRMQPASAETRRGSLRLDEDDRADAQDATPGEGSGRLGLHLHRRSLQSGADPQPHGGDVSSRARAKPGQLRPGELAPGPVRPELTGPRPPSHPSRGETFSAAC